MDCRDCQDNLSTYLDGTLGRRTATRVREHLDFCASCREEWETLQQLREALRAVSAPTARPDFWPRMHRLLQDHRALTGATPPRAPWFGIRRFAALGSLTAAALVMMVAGARTYTVAHRPPPAPATQPVQIVQMPPTPAPEIAAVAAPPRHVLRRPPVKHKPHPAKRAQTKAICVDALVGLHASECSADPLADTGRLDYLGDESDQADVKDDGKLDIH